MFSNFNKRDSLTEAVENAMQDGELRRQAVSIVNEAFGVYNRNAVIREELAEYDAAIESTYADLKEEEKKAKKDYDKDGKIESEKDEVWGSRLRAAKAAGKLAETPENIMNPNSEWAKKQAADKNNPFNQPTPNPTEVAPNIMMKGVKGDGSSSIVDKVKNMFREGALDPKDSSVQGSGDVTKKPYVDNTIPQGNKTYADLPKTGNAAGSVIAKGKDALREDEQLDEVNVKQIKKDLDSGMSHDAVIGKHANKRTTNTDEIRKVIKQHAWDKRMKKEETQIDELKRTTLVNYINKAAKSKATPNNIYKRGKGLELAAKKMDRMEESTQIDEVSNKTKQNYIDAAIERVKGNRAKGFTKAFAPKKGAKAEAERKSFDKRSKGMTRAITTMKENEQVDEAMSRKAKDAAVRRFMSHDPKAGESILAMGKKDREEKKSFASAKKEITDLKSKNLEEERKRTASVADAFMSGQKANQKTLRTDGKQVTYHGHVIAKHEGDEVHVTTAGYGHHPSTRGHVNGILSRLGAGGVHVKKGQLYHNDKPHDDNDWIKVKKPQKATFGEETLDEVSKSTLVSYIKKASHDVGTQSAATGRYADRANKALAKYKNGGNYADWQEHEKNGKVADRAFNKSWNRRKGIAKAADKLTNEESQLDEVGFANKFSPLKKTTPDSGYMNLGRGKGHGFSSSNPDMRINRRAGLDKDVAWDDDAQGAYDKQQRQMAKFKTKAKSRLKEEEQLDELKRSTIIKYVNKVAASKPKTPENLTKRTKGLQMASRRLEEGTLTEAHRELALYADNHAGLHRQSHEPIMKNLSRKVAKGTYDHEKATKLWGYHADRAAQSYAKEHGDGTPWHKMFSKADRKKAAEHFANSAKDDLNLKEGVVSQAQLSAFRAKSGNANATLGQYMNAQRGLTARKGGANDPDVIASKSATTAPKPSPAANYPDAKNVATGKDFKDIDNRKMTAASTDDMEHKANAASFFKKGVDANKPSNAVDSASASMPASERSTPPNNATVTPPRRPAELSKPASDPGAAENKARASGNPLEEGVKVGNKTYRII